MATYGKRRKGPLSSFAVFQDDSQKQKLDKQPLSHALQLKSKDKGIKLHGPARSDDESIDELAGEALLKDIPKQLATTESLRNRSSQTEFQSASQTAQVNPRREPLAEKTPNLKINIGREGVSSQRRPKISPPILQSSTVQTVNDWSRPATARSLNASPFIETAPDDPVELSRKISNLLRQAAAQEAESKQKAAVLNRELAKPSPRQRARQAVAWASKAVKGKLKSSPSANSSPPQIFLDIGDSSKVSLLTNPFVQDTRDEGLARRLAEGLNLSNPKIQSMTGASKTPRKPLPIYESMRSRMDQSDTSENPFLDGNDEDSEYESPAPLPATLLTVAGGEDTESQKAHSTGKAREDTDPSYGSKFSSDISGLAQHSDTMYFSNSPDATSTPPSRLRIRQGDGSIKRLSKQLENRSEDSPSIPKGGDVSISPSTISKSMTDGSQSVKRKSAQENLRSLASPAPKKPRIHDQQHDGADIDLAFGLVGPGLGSGPSSPEHGPIKKQRPQGKKNMKRKGLAIFEVGKGKAPEDPQEERPVLRTRFTNGTTSKRSSFSRPSSMFGIDLKHSGRGKFAKLEGGDAMDVDELA